MHNEKGISFSHKSSCCLHSEILKWEILLACRSSCFHLHSASWKRNLTTRKNSFCHLHSAISKREILLACRNSFCHHHSACWKRNLVCSQKRWCHLHVEFVEKAAVMYILHAEKWIFICPQKWLLLSYFCNFKKIKLFLLVEIAAVVFIVHADKII